MTSLFGAYELLENCGLFDAEYYVKANPDLGFLNEDPLLHYLETGAGQRRHPHPDFDTAYYLEQCGKICERPDNPLLHFITVGRARGLKPKRSPILADRSPAVQPSAVA